MSYVVILFSDRWDDDEPLKPCPLSHCPMEVWQFATLKEAKVWAREQPGWTQPHTLQLNHPATDPT